MSDAASPLLFFSISLVSKRKGKEKKKKKNVSHLLTPSISDATALTCLFPDGCIQKACLCFSTVNHLRDGKKKNVVFSDSRGASLLLHPQSSSSSSSSNRWKKGGASDRSRAASSSRNIPHGGSPEDRDRGEKKKK